MGLQITPLARPRDAEARRALNFGRILYATDFSRQSNEALPFVRSLAAHYGSTVYVTNVISMPPWLSNAATQTWGAMTAQGLREARESMDHLEPRWAGVAHEMLIRKGDIWREVERIVEEKKIGLIVAGTHGYSGVSRLLVGSVAEKIFRHAGCPVLTVGPSTRCEASSIADLHSILCPMDFAAESRSALAAAVELAQEHGSRLYLVHVLPENVDKETERDLAKKLRERIATSAALWCEPKCFVEYGAAADRIVEIAEELAIDLIVMGPKQLPLVPGSGRLPGTTAYRVVSRANCPVLTVRA
jgi:nucleotide-binding universal stress UspA family protein